MKYIEYYIGIDPKDIQLMNEFMSVLNTDINTYLHVTVMDTFDEPHGYYTYTLKGTWESYKKFLDEKTFIKSVNHFYE